MARSDFPTRRCNGLIEGSVVRCEHVATVVCTDATGLQWYACEAPAHRPKAVKTEPVADFFARLFEVPS